MTGFSEHIIFGKQYLGIEVFSRAGRDHFAILEASRTKSELLITKSGLVTALEQYGKSKLPAFVVVNNSHVLQKEVESVEANDRKLLHKAFPNLNPEDFYFEIVRFSHRSVIALCRKTYIDGLLESLKGNFRIASLSLGIAPVKQLAGFSLPDVAYTNTQAITIEGETLIQPFGSPPDTAYSLNGLTIENKYLLAFGGILQFLLKSEGGTGNIRELNSALKENFFQQAFFERGFKAALSFILILLLANFFAFSYYFDKAAELKESAALNQADTESIARLKGSVAEKQRMLTAFTRQASSRSSEMVGELVKEMPSTIGLKELIYCPLEKKPKENEPILLDEKRITLTGNTISNEDFTAWVGQVQRLGWVDKVTIASFGKDKENKTVFDLKITLK